MPGRRRNRQTFSLYWLEEFVTEPTAADPFLHCRLCQLAGNVYGRWTARRDQENSTACIRGHLLTQHFTPLLKTQPTRVLQPAPVMAAAGPSCSSPVEEQLLDHWLPVSPQLEPAAAPDSPPGADTAHRLPPLPAPISTAAHVDSLLANLTAHLQLDSHGVVLDESDYEQIIGSNPWTRFQHAQISAAVYAANSAFNCSTAVTQRVLLSNQRPAPAVDKQQPGSLEALTAVWLYQLRFAVVRTNTMAVGNPETGMQDRYQQLLSVWWLRAGLLMQHVLSLC